MELEEKLFKVGIVLSAIGFSLGIIGASYYSDKPRERVDNTESRVLNERYKNLVIGSSIIFAGSFLGYKYTKNIGGEIHFSDPEN